jgi:hypothetical protein
VPIPGRRQLLRSKAVVVSVAEGAGTIILAGTVHKSERKRTADEVSKAGRPANDIESDPFEIGTQLCPVEGAVVATA